MIDDETAHGSRSASLENDEALDRATEGTVAGTGQRGAEAFEQSDVLL
jgi:hypothetical protein